MKTAENLKIEFNQSRATNEELIRLVRELPLEIEARTPNQKSYDDQTFIPINRTMGVALNGIICFADPLERQKKGYDGFTELALMPHRSHTGDNPASALRLESVKNPSALITLRALFQFGSFFFEIIV